MVACGLNPASSTGPVAGRISRPCKKRRLVQRRREFGVDERLEDLGVDEDGTRRRRRTKECKKKVETLEEKLRRKVGHPSLKPWTRAGLGETYPSSSEDESCGWVPPGDYMRSLFDLPDGFMGETSAEAETTGEGDSGLTDSRGEL